MASELIKEFPQYADLTADRKLKVFLDQLFNFLRGLFKGADYVELAYMTGILPIAKYSGGSELNMFSEYNMATQEKFSGYFGFS